MINNILEALKEYKNLIAINFVFILASFGILFFNIVLLGDDWGALIDGNYAKDFTVSVGRWMHRLISDITFDKSFAPSFSATILAISTIVSGVIMLDVFKFELKIQKYIFTLLFVVYPVWTEAYFFKMGQLPKAFAILSSVLSAYLFVKYILEGNAKINFHKTTYFLFSSILLIFTAACYQTYAFLTIVIISIWFILNFSDNPSKKIVLRNIVVFFTWSLISAVFYYISLKFAIFIYDAPVRTSGMYNVSSPISSLNMYDSATKTISVIVEFFTKEQTLIPAFTKYLLIISIFLYLVFVLVLNKGINKFNKLLAFFFFVFIVILPWSLGIIRENAPFRYNSLVSLCLLNAFFITLPISFLKKINKYTYNIYVIAVLATIITFTYTNSAASTAKYISNKRDFALSQELLTRIHQLPNYEPNERFGIAFIGRNKIKRTQRPFDFFDRKSKIRSLTNCGAWDCQLQQIPQIFALLGETATFYRIKKGIIKNLKEENINSEIFNDINEWPKSNSIIQSKNGEIIYVIFDIRKFRSIVTGQKK